MKRFIRRIDLCNYGGWESPQSAFCKLEDQASEWHNSALVWGLRNRGADGESPSLKAWGWGVQWWSPGLSRRPKNQMSKGRRRWVSQLKQREHTGPSSAFLFYSRPQRIGRRPPTLAKVMFFTRVQFLYGFEFTFLVIWVNLWVTNQPSAGSCPQTYLFGLSIAISSSFWC